MEYQKETFLEDLKRYAPGLKLSRDIGVLQTPVSSFPAIRNRLAAQPVEGCDAREDGGVSDRALRRYEQLARGGAGLIWVESTAIDEIGRTNERQLWIRESNLDSFSKLTEMIHDHGCGYIVLQLTHAGICSIPGKDGSIPCVFKNPYLPEKDLRVLSDEELEVISMQYIEAAELAWKAGFDAVDIRACHGYLLNELLGAYTRPGKYGGSLQNRISLMLHIISKVRERVPVDIVSRLNMLDGIPYPYGWGTIKDEPMQLIKALSQNGVSMVNITAGNGDTAPYMIRPYDKESSPEHPLSGVYRLLSFAKEVKESFPELAVIASGFSWLRDFAGQIAAGCIGEGWFDLAGFGRASIADPSFADCILNQREYHMMCNTCDGCIELIKKGREMRCVRRPAGSE